MRALSVFSGCGEFDIAAELARIKVVGQIEFDPDCQPVSVAGQREAADDERNMWPEYIRLVREIIPR